MSVATGICPDFGITDHNRAVVADLFNWCCMLPGRLDPDKGLCLWGNIGTGKSTMLNIVREFCLKLKFRRNNGEPSFRLTNIAEVCAAYEKEGFDGIETYFRSPAQGFDDVGTETIPTGHFGTNLNVFQSILQMRYDNRHVSITHMTTNLSPKGIASVYGDRVYDRCKEMFNFIEFTGKTLRK